MSVTVANAGNDAVAAITTRTSIPNNFRPTLVQIAPAKDGFQYNLSIGFSNLLQAVYVGTEVDFTTPLTATQNTIQWWSPRIATGADVYTNFVCTQAGLAVTGTAVTRNTPNDFTTAAAATNTAATALIGTAVTLSILGDVTVVPTKGADTLSTGCQIKITLGSIQNALLKTVKYGDTLSYRAGYKLLVSDATKQISDAQTADLTFAIVDGAVALAVGAAISSVMVNFF
jgi:hypothetical protein